MIPSLGFSIIWIYFGTTLFCDFFYWLNHIRGFFKVCVWMCVFKRPSAWLVGVLHRDLWMKRYGVILHLFQSVLCIICWFKTIFCVYLLTGVSVYTHTANFVTPLLQNGLHKSCVLLNLYPKMGNLFLKFISRLVSRSFLVLIYQW